MQKFEDQVPAQAQAHPLLGVQFPTLTGFRGVCILWVIFAHLPLALPEWLANPQERWGIGVDLFLAVSGFLVTRSLFQSDFLTRKKGGSAWDAAREFLIRRVSRIFPPYYAMLALVAFVALFVDKNLYARLKENADILPGFVFFFSNYLIPNAIDRVPAILNGMWSLGFQEQFYLILLAFYLGSKKHFHWLVLGAGLASLVTRILTVLYVWPNPGGSAHTAHLEMYLHLHFDSITWACLAWVYFDELGKLWSTPARARLANAGVILFFCSILTAHSFLPGDLAQALIYCFKGPALALVVRAICAMDTSQVAFARLLRVPALGRIGIAAYEIYLINALVIAALMKLHVNNHQGVFVVLTYLGSVSMGWACYEIFGRRSQNWMKSLLRGKSRVQPKAA